MCVDAFFLHCTNEFSLTRFCTVSRAALSSLWPALRHPTWACLVTWPPSCGCRSWSLKGDKRSLWLGNWWAGWRWCQLSVKSQRDECRWCRFIDQTLEGGWRRTGIMIVIAGPHLHLVCDLLMAGYVYWEPWQSEQSLTSVGKTHLVWFFLSIHILLLLNSFLSL